MARAPAALTTGMRILFASTRGAGHVGPLIPFAHACLRAGHEVLVAAPRSAAPVLARAALAHLAHDDSPEHETAAIHARMRDLPHDEANAVAFAELFAGVHPRTALPALLAALRRSRFDLLVGEISAFAAPLAAERTGVPYVPVEICLAYDVQTALAAGAEPLRRLRAHAGLPP